MSIDEVQLIENIRIHECLYNNKIGEYKNLQRKAEAWQEIATNINAEVLECKAKWNLLRNAFLHALIRRNRSGRGATIFRKWRYENEMSFLLPFLSHGKGVLNVRRCFEVNDQVDDQVDDHVDDCTETQYYSDDNSIEEVTPEKGIKRKNYCQIEITEHKRQCAKEEEDQDKEEVESNESHKVDYNKEMFQLIKEKIKKRKEDKDEIDLLFESLAKAVKQLPKSEQVKVKVGITKLVYEAQMRNEDK